jgi:hypothetical protein
VTDLVRWLEGRRPEPPPSLQEAMARVVRDGDPGQGAVSARLAEAAFRALAAVTSGPSVRAHALPLLAVDALLTAACEAALEESASRDGDGGDPVAAFADSFGPQRFAGLLRGEVSG